MKKMIKTFLRNVLYREKASSERYVSFLKKQGCKIGEDVTIYVPTSTEIDITRPWLVEIGNHVKITKGVTILTHGYDWAVLKAVYGDVLGSSGRVKIGDNVFIGMHTTILKGVNIGNNVIIGANSVVTKDIPDNCVAVGNPCRVIMNIQEYYKKRKLAQLEEARELVRLYKKRYGKNPDDYALHEFFWLFTDGNTELTPIWKNVMELMGNGQKSYETLSKNKKQFDSMEAFIDSINSTEDFN